jgi:hypothetical protein
MSQVVLFTLVSLILFAFFLATGIICLFHPHWLQRRLTSDEHDLFSESLLYAFRRKVLKSEYFIWHARTTGVIALVGAAVGLVALIGSLVEVLSLINR